MYRKKPTAAQAASFGLTVEEASGSSIEIWPDNVLAFNVFVCMGTQWLVGPGGPYGLNYASLHEIWRRTKVPPNMRDQVFDDLRTMEDAALEEIRKTE